MLSQAFPYRFEEFVADTRQATTGDELLALLKRAVARQGYDRISLWVLDDPDLPLSAHGRGTLHNFPEDLRVYYQENNCVRYDPVLLAQRARPAIVDWETHEKRASYSPAQIELYEVARGGGLNNGISTPLWGPRGLAATLGLASTERIDAVHSDPDMINALAAQFYTAFKRLYGHKTEQPDDPVYLTAKETEILSWVAAGKTDDDIATILSISRNTVDSHMRHIFQKLGVHSRVTAVVKGIARGHIGL